MLAVCQQQLFKQRFSLLIIHEQISWGAIGVNGNGQLARYEIQLSGRPVIDAQSGDLIIGGCFSNHVFLCAWLMFRD